MARYVSRLRPIGIGCIPKYENNKILKIEHFDYRMEYNGIMGWGIVEYEREIPSEDAFHYSLSLIDEIE